MGWRPVISAHVDDGENQQSDRDADHHVDKQATAEVRQFHTGRAIEEDELATMVERAA